MNSDPYVPTEEELDALVIYVDSDHRLRGAEYGPLHLHSALPKLSDEHLTDTVAKAVALGFFEGTTDGRIRIALDGYRRASLAKYRKRIFSRLPFEWTSVPNLSLADTVLVYAAENYRGRVVWLEDLYVAFATTSLAELKNAVESLRDAGLFVVANVDRLRKSAQTFSAHRDPAWAGGVTRDGTRRASHFRENQLIQKLIQPAVYDVLDRFVYKDGALATMSAKKIFIVHGHNRAMLREVQVFVQRIGLEPIVLMDEVNRGRTVIEKFEEVSDVGFAIVLLSPDDIGRAYTDPLGSEKRRPRQNAVLELGFFIGRLGRDRVAVFVDANLDAEAEYPSDLAGVLTIRYQIDNDWMTRLLREFAVAKLEFDAKKL